MARCAWLMAAGLALAAGCAETHPPSPFDRGMSLMRTGGYGEAIDAFSAAIRLNPRDAQAYLMRGRAYQCRNEAGDVGAAIADFTAAIGFDPRSSEAYYSRAIAYRDRGAATGSKEDAELARQDDAKAREIDRGVAYEEDEAIVPSAKLPPIVPAPVAAETSEEPPSDEAPAKSAEVETPADKQESADDVVRRLEAEVRAMENENKRGKSRVPEGAAGGSRTLRTPSSGMSSTVRDDAVRGSRRTNPLDSRTRSGAETGKSRASSADRGEAARDPLPITEFDPQPATGQGAKSRYSGGPLSGARRPGAATLPGTDSAIVPTVPQYRSPFPQRQPSPTGIIREQPTEGAPRQPRPYYTTPSRVRDDLR